MTFLVGLGNPDRSYQYTRHNLGWRVLDALCDALHMHTREQWKRESSLFALTRVIDQALLVKPLTYMNLSGDAVRAVMKKYDYARLGEKDFRRLFVVYDDLDIPVGKYKLLFGSGPKTHNGVNHICQTLTTDQFWHVRIGVDGRAGDRSQSPSEYVLQEFNSQESLLIDKVVDSVVQLLLDTIQHIDHPESHLASQA